MILVEVQVPALCRRYDFELEETVPVRLLLPEMIEAICQKERLSHSETPQGMSLYLQDRHTRLNAAGTLLQNGVCGGQKLIRHPFCPHLLPAHRTDGGKRRGNAVHPVSDAFHPIWRPFPHGHAIIKPSREGRDRKRGGKRCAGIFC